MFLLSKIDSTEIKGLSFVERELLRITIHESGSSRLKANENLLGFI